MGPVKGLCQSIKEREPEESVRTQSAKSDVTRKELEKAETSATVITPPPYVQNTPWGGDCQANLLVTSKYAQAVLRRGRIRGRKTKGGSTSNPPLQSDHNVLSRRTEHVFLPISKEMLVPYRLSKKSCSRKNNCNHSPKEVRERPSDASNHSICVTLPLLLPSRIL